MISFNNITIDNQHISTKKFVISVGGSLLVPDDISIEFIKNFKDVIIKYIKQKYKFVLVIGGGKIARKYIYNASKISKITNEDKDWLGIHSTRLNAHLIRTIFRKYAHPRINTNPHNLEDFYYVKEPIIVAAGWRPGCSTDYVAVVLAKYLSIKNVVNLSNISYLYDKDPKYHKDAKIIKKISWDKYRSMIGNKWIPGLNTPFDPIASKYAQEEKIHVSILNGSDLNNFENYLQGKKYIGTLIY